MPSTFSAEFIAFLECPESYPHRPDTVEHIQTHISHVFIASPYVYKIKKPVDFGFLDFSALERRKHFCEREVELNRRLCDGPYLGVVPIFSCGDGWTFDCHGGGEPVEFAVWMEELAEENMLITHARQGRLSPGHLDLVAETLVPFYVNQTQDEGVSKWSRPEKIKANTDENFEQTEAFIGGTISKVAFETIRTFTNRYLDRHAGLFGERIARGRIVDGHGDLRLEHIHIRDKKVWIIDCIEFNNRFRCHDIASDIAFLAMDLDFNGLRQESAHFVRQMAERMDDPGLLRMIDFYKCYRAYVRGKVKSFESREEDVPEDGRRTAAKLAARYFSLALNYALFGSRPGVLVFMGRVASGKSTLAGEVAGQLNVRCFASDTIRKELAGVPLNGRTNPDDKAKVYSEATGRRTYQKLIEHAKGEVMEGRCVVLDATFSDPDRRRELRTALEGTDAEVYFIEATAPNTVRRERLGQRKAEEGVVSDARLEDIDFLDQKYQAPKDVDPAHFIAADTGGDVESCLMKVFGRLLD